MSKFLSSTFALLVFTFISCTHSGDKLPIAGEREVVKKMIDGKEVVDTIYQTIPPFSFTDQDGNTITNQTFKNKIYVADFVFLSCNSICPKMNVQMKRLYDKYTGNPVIVFLSHTIDPENDTKVRIKEYMNSLKVETSKWHFVRGPEEDILKIANQGYFYVAYKDSVHVDPAKQYQHSGWMILVDPQGRVRSAKDGTDQFEVEKLIKDIDILLAEVKDEVSREGKIK